MYKISAGLVTIEGEQFGCFIEIQSGCENFIHLANGENYNESEVDELRIFTDEFDIDVEEIARKIEKKYIDDGIACDKESNIKNGMKVKVYDGDFVGWTFGVLVKDLGNGRWTIFTDEEYCLDRLIKEEYTEMLKDGCGYVVESIHCPSCGSYEVDAENLQEVCCYECDTYWNSVTNKIIEKQ